MKKLGLVLILAAFCLVPVVADAQWGPQGSFVYPEPQIGYPYSGTPQVMYPAPPAMYPAPTVIYSPPPVMIQVQPAPPPQVITVPARPEKRVETRVQGDGINVVTKCVNCTVTNNVYANGAKVIPKNGNGNGTASDTKPASTAVKPWWDDPRDLWIWLFVLLIVLLCLAAVIIIKWMEARPGSRPGTPGPTLEPPAPGPTAPAAPRLARPRPRVHTKKCQHDGCPHTLTICCHNNGDDQAANGH